MAQYGMYDPINAENTSSLFVFQEVPVTSSKLNRWNGNIATSFSLLHSICATLFSSAQSAVLSTGSPDALSVGAVEPSSLRVLVQPGWAVIAESFAGITAQSLLPIGQNFSVPNNYPRIDLIVLDQNGQLNVLQGEESSSPSAPETPGNSIALAQVYLRPDCTQILESDDGIQGYVIDVRPSFLVGEAHRHNEDHSPVEIPDGTRTHFSTEHIYRDGTLDVFVNGVLQKNNEDYTENVDRTGYGFITPPRSNYLIQHRYVIEREIS